jgi:hypothetical protein
MAFTMACPNFKKGLKMAFGPLGVKKIHINYKMYLQTLVFVLHVQIMMNNIMVDENHPLN